MRLKVVVSLLLVVGLATWFIFKTSEITIPVMGTTVRVKVSGPLAFWRARQAVAEIKRLEKIFRPVTDSPDTVRVLALAEAVKKASHGAFDVRWSGKIDLGGIGKGYAVEVARRVLLKNGVKSAIIDMHSSIAVIGDGWKIGIFDPRTKCFFKRIVLNDKEALSTSGQYEQPGHIIDPRTGKAADKCMSVTVVCKDAALADALSTAIFVLGPTKGISLAAKIGARTLIVDKNGKTYDNLSVKLR
ncbi:MAG: FAD:protein FMN transferase [Candidatus Margulisiibacteriota bacterium]